MKTIKLLTLLLLMFITALQAQEITLDHVNGTWDDNGTTCLVPDCDPTFYISANNTYDNKVISFSHGFHIYTLGFNNFPASITMDTVSLTPSWNYRFFTGPVFDTTNLDGFYPEVIGFSCIGRYSDIGFEVGFNDVFLSITTTGVPLGETLCIDSSYFPSIGYWVWTPSMESSIVPSWDGPHCFEAKNPTCTTPAVATLPDTIFTDDCDTASATFTLNEICSVGETIVLISGPGIIELENTIGTESTFNWSWSVNTTIYEQSITIGQSSPVINCGEPYNLQTIPVALQTVVGDVNMDCRFDISDLLALIDYFFGEYNGPINPDLADCNNSGTFDISDLLYMVDYFFLPGSSPCLGN